MTQLTVDMVAAYVEYLKENGTGDGPKIYFRMFKRMVTAAVDKDLIKKNPCRGFVLKNDNMTLHNETLLQKLKFKLPIDELDADLIEDVNIEMSQARETAHIYAEILESTMDTYTSIINNNMNTVMRTLTSFSIILMFPTLISSLFGMNLVNGMESSEWGFPVALVISVIVSIGSWLTLRRKNLL